MVRLLFLTRGDLSLMFCCFFHFVCAAPCDIYARDGTPCVAAHSVVRALFSDLNNRTRRSFNETEEGSSLKLYQLKRFYDNKTLDIYALAPYGLANATAHEEFCSGKAENDDAAAMMTLKMSISSLSYPRRAECVIFIIYDQTGNGNHLKPASPAISNPAYNNPVNATRHQISINGMKAYGAYFETGMGYRAQNTKHVALGNDPETIYMVTSGTHVNSLCCFDCGNAENDCLNGSSFRNGAMEAVYFGTGYGGLGKGNWVGADLENGIYGGKYVEDAALLAPFVTVMVKGGTDGFVTKGGDAASGKLKKFWDGPRPSGYQPMHKTGAIVLGMGGDNFEHNIPHTRAEGVPALSIGTFYEGLMTAGFTSDNADDAVQADIVAAGYGN